MKDIVLIKRGIIVKRMILEALFAIILVIACTAGVFAEEIGEEVPEYNLDGNYTVIVDTGFSYTGDEIRPKVIVVDNDLIDDEVEYYHDLYEWYCEAPFFTEYRDMHTLSPENYKVEYADNIDAGCATVKVSGIEPYTGEISGSFYIFRRKFAADKVINKDYSVSIITGQPAKEIEEVTFDGRKLIRDKDYTVSDGKVKIKYSYLKGTKRMASWNLNHQSQVLYKNAFMNCKIRSYNIGAVAYSPISLEYSGKTKSPVSIYGNSVKKGRDYKVIYDKKKRAKIGKYYYTIKGIYPFAGKIRDSYEVRPKMPKLKSYTSKKNSLKLTWSKVKNCTGYQIHILKELPEEGDEPSYKVVKRITIKDKKTTSRTIRISCKDYTDVRIRAYKIEKGKKYYSTWKYRYMYY